VKANQAKHSVRVMCRLLKVSKSGFYAWDRHVISARERSDIELTVRIRAIHQRSRETYGAPKIHAELADDHGIRVGRKRVARLMRSAGIRGATLRKFVVTTVSDLESRNPADLVERRFYAERPNRLWVADLTYIPTWSGFLYLAVVIDVFSRKVVGWAMENHLRTELVLAAIDMAITMRRPAAVIHHSDHGCQPGFNWSSQHCLRPHLTSNIFIAAQSDAEASERGARCGARGWLSASTQDLVERFGWRSPAERLSGSGVEGNGHCIEFS